MGRATATGFGAEPRVGVWRGYWHCGMNGIGSNGNTNLGRVMNEPVILFIYPSTSEWF